MGDSEVLVVRFHFNGEFVLDGSTVEYCNGDEGISHIEKDKLSVPELEGHLLDHTTFKRSVRMYWLPFGAALNSGMRLIVDDKSCLDMLDELGCVGAVDIYTELIDVNMNAMDEADLQDTVGDEAVFDLFRDENVMHLDPPAPITDAHIADQSVEDDPGTHEDEQIAADENEDESKSELEATGFTSNEDDEAQQIRSNYKAYMSNRKMKGGIPLDTEISMDLPTGNECNNIVEVNEIGDGLPYFESD
ncbi:unnamed protein product [Urochloa humidicola]